MNSTKIVQEYLTQSLQAINALNIEQVTHAIQLIHEAWQNNRQIIIFGNGGSALTASHYITDWNKSAILTHSKKFRGVCLNDNMGLITAYSNDISYEKVFSEQLKNVLEPKDLVIAISGSGNSPNILNAINYANENGGTTLGICGFNGGKLKQLAQHHVWVNINDMQIVEDLHLTFGHLVMKTLCQK
ncbi:MAG: SIS domain-containing protein [Verrucomicrobiae bacterium]|nr:SIS domain-containing protein [Verrucomicrobiae bacterium]